MTIAIALIWPLANMTPAHAQSAKIAPKAVARSTPGQQAPDTKGPASDPETVAPEIIVTGSRIVRDGFDAPTPVTVVGADEIAKQGATNVADVLNRVPSFLASTTPAANGLTMLDAANVLNLRALGGKRTLILLDGKRFIPTTTIGLVDINLIPQVLIDRVEVVTGGASAAYGSDAVAGVVNFILNDKFEGVQGSIQSGIAEEGDNNEYRAALAVGGQFADGRGHVMVSGELFDNNGIRHQTDRDWGRDEWQVIANPAFAPGNGQPRRITVAQVHQANRADGGVILSGPLAGNQFAPDGTLVPFRSGSLSNGQFQVGGDGVNQGDLSPLKIPVSRQTFLADASYEITDDIRVVLTGNFSRAHSEDPFTNSFSFAPYTIREGNPFLPASVEAQLAPGSTFALGRRNRDFGFLTADSTSRVYRGVAAIEGSFADTWKWSAYYQYGRTTNRVVTHNDLIVANLNRAIDAVRDANGQIVCRSTLADPTNGCVPIDLFGFNAPSAASIGYVLGDQEEFITTRQDVAAADLQGNPFSTWAGPVSVAVGTEYRKESANDAVDAISRSSGFLIGNPQPLSGSYNVKEAYGEVAVPLLADLSFAKSLDLDLAARLTDYSLSGTVTTWKAGVTYAVNDSLRFRATRSRDIRAPNLSELFTPNNLGFDQVLDPSNGVPTLVTVNLQGNPDLKPEKADTLTFGMVVEPSFLNGFRASIDYYDIDVKGAITTLGDQDIVDRCFAGAADLCALLTRDSSGAITSIRSPFLNVGSLKTRGLDFEVDYRTALDGIDSSWAGSVGARVLATYVDKLSTSDGVTTIDRAGDIGEPQNGGVPNWRVTGSLSYDGGPVGISLIGRYIASGKYNNTFVEGVDIDDNHVPARFYLDGSITFTVVDNGVNSVQMFGVVNNIFNEDPPRAPSQFQNAYYTNPALYDVIGRNFTAGVRFKF